ncbi:MAG: preprotein translocase subunit SecY [Bacilli bacterium]|nr:preprotein translocase subunit SecY [Bacilli bacterium]
MIKKITSILKNKEVLNRIIFTLVILFIFKLGSTITIPRVDITNVDIQNSSDIFGLMNILGGGALKRFSLFALGVSPYITASIVVNLLSMGILPKLEELTKQGAQGRKKLDDTTRALTVLLAGVQAYGIVVTMQNQYGLSPIGGGSFSFWDYIYLIVITMAGTFLLVWMADQITSKGVGNGVSIIIFAGIITEIPYQIVNAFQNFVGVDVTGGAIFNGVIKFSIYLLAYLLLVIFVIFMERSIRKVPIQYASTTFQARTNDVTYLPIKINSAGVIPVIFASSVLTAPPIIMNFLSIPRSNPVYQILSINGTYLGIPFGLILYIILIIVFTYFYTGLQVDPVKISDNFAKSGAYIPGIRPGNETAKYLKKVIYRVTTLGALFLTIISALPMFLTMYLSLPSSIAFGGTGLIIVVGVILETAKEIDGRLAAKEYQGFIG